MAEVNGTAKSKRKFWVCQTAILAMTWLGTISIFKNVELPVAFWLGIPTIPSLYFGANAVGDHQALKGMFNKDMSTKAE